jgi:hypothetical protein
MVSNNYTHIVSAKTFLSHKGTVSLTAMSKVKIYATIANAFTATDIAEPVLKVQAKESGLEVCGKFSELVPHNIWFCIVYQGKWTMGYLCADDHIDYGKPVGKQITPFSPDQFIPASIPIVQLLPLFRKHFFLFVLDKNQINHAVSFNDIDKLPVKMCIFSLFMELESQMLRTMNEEVSRPQRLLEHLTISRLRKAQDLCRLKYGEETANGILLCTTFIDKVKMFQSDSSLSNLLPFKNKREGNRFFSLVERMRNQIAHSDSLLTVISDPVSLNDFISSLNDVILALSSRETWDR